jgi:hypothetical protein
MKNQDDKPLFTVSNHHTGNCGQPPGINGDRPNRYHGYFENALGEQFVFVYHRVTGKADLWCGDAGWEKPFAVANGQPEGLILSPEEQTWLQACWSAAGRMTG